MGFQNDMYTHIELYLASLEASDYAKNTIESYEIHLRNYYSYCRQKNINYKIITVKEILNYKILISKQYAPSSINAKLSSIKSFCDFLIDIDEMETNPIRKSMYIRTDSRRPRPLSKKDKELFFSFIETKEKHIELGFKILFDTGIRISELTRLKKEDVKIIDDRVFLYIKKTKNRKERLVPIFSETLIKELMEYIEESYSGTLFYRTIRAFQLYSERFREEYQVEFTTHIARHTFASEKLNEGMRLDVLQTILGHADIRATMYYSATDKSEILKLGGTVNDQIKRTFQ